ncbi:MAG: hypothetical protein IT305_08385 [Chloroflexi bacterium]|nr:hypothetical protein [Chloroflexota bacterium]
MKPVGRYDTSLQMFVEEPREPNLARLGFMRWLAERGRLEHAPMGEAEGEFARPTPVAERRSLALAS